MIGRQDIAVTGIVILANGVKLIGSEAAGSRPNAIAVRTESGEIEIPDFAEMRYSSDADRLVPTCEVALWRGKAFIVGLPSVVIAGKTKPMKCDLFRKGGEDTGFYKTDWVEVGQCIFCIYEAGIATWNENGELLWHIRKSWDDVFTGVGDGGLTFLMHDGQKVTIDPSDGSRRPLSGSSVITPPN